jgi:murein DD-endopeptidase MepM/ murein hydrolase activator NlpD
MVAPLGILAGLGRTAASAAAGTTARVGYRAALGQTLKDSAKGIVSGFGSGLKGAMLSEVPLLTAGYGALSSLRKDANQPVTDMPGGSSTKSSITGNPFAQMIQQLAQINANTTFSARADRVSVQAEKYRQTFAEEETRERAQQNKALIDAIKNSGLGGGGRGGSGEAVAQEEGDGFFVSLLKGLLKGVLLGGPALFKFLSGNPRTAGSLALGTGAGAAAAAANRGPSSAPQTQGTAGSTQAGTMGAYKSRAPTESTSPVGQPTTSGGNETSSLKWRVPLRDSYTVTSEHDEQRGPPKYKQNYTHKGVDLALYYGAPVVAAADGLITVNSHNDRTGNFVMMDHGNGYTTLYAHLHMSHSMPGTKVTAGTVIGYVGTSGHSSGPHLHFEIRLNGVSKNPRDFIQLGKKAKLTKVDREAETPKPGNADSGEVGAKGSALQAKKVSITPSSSSTPLIEMGDGRVAEAYASAGVNNPTLLTSAQVDAEIRRASGQGYFTQREKEANNQRVLKELSGIKENTRITAKEVKINRITMSGGKFKSPELLLREANKQFRDSLQKQLTRTISGSLMKALYPGGYKNVSQRTASGQMYRGEQLNKMLGLTPQLTKLGTSIFGKQYGPAFGQIFSKAATGYMEVGARSVAKGIFGSLGMNTDQANILGGQILGNLAKGTKAGKVTALEQIIYGMSGGKVALGAETIFAKYGFASPADGIGYMANVLGAGIMGPIDSALGTTPSSMGNMDPRMRQMGAFGGYGGQYGGMPGGGSIGNLNLGDAQRALAANPAFAYGDTGRLSTTTTSPEAKLLVEQINLAKDREMQAKKDFLEASKSDDERAALQRVISDSQYEQQVRTNELLSQRGSGSGSSAGGFFNQLLGVKPGDKGMMGAFAEVGNMALDFGKAALTQKVVQKLGIKNPYMQLLASAAVNKGLSIGGEYAFNAIKGTEAGSSIINYGSTLLAGAKTAFPSIFGASAAPTAASIASGNALALGVAPGTLAASSAAAPAAIAAETALAGTAAAGTTAAVVGQSAAVTEAVLLADTLGGSAAAASAAGGTLGSTLLAAAPYLLAAAVIYKLFKRKKRTPKPVMSRIMRVLDNNDINAKTFSNLDVGYDTPPKEWQPIADALLNVGFNATKSAEVETKEKSSYEFIMVTIENDGIKFHADSGDPKNSQSFIGLGKLDNTFNSSTAATSIIKFVADIFKRDYANKSAQVDKAVTDLHKLTYAQVGNELTSSLKSKIDTSVSSGVFGTVEQDKMLADYKFNTKMAEQYIQGESSSDYIAPQVYSQKEGKYVEAPFTMVDQLGDDGFGNVNTYKVKKYDTDVLMLDKDGNPIYDVDKSGGLTMADFVTPAKSTVSATVIASSAEVAGASASKGVTVNTVSDNSSTTTDQSQNITYTSMLSSSRNAITDSSVNAEIAIA